MPPVTQQTYARRRARPRFAEERSREAQFECFGSSSGGSGDGDGDGSSPAAGLGGDDGSGSGSGGAVSRSETRKGALVCGDAGAVIGEKVKVTESENDAQVVEESAHPDSSESGAKVTIGVGAGASPRAAKNTCKNKHTARRKPRQPLYERDVNVGIGRKGERVITLAPRRRLNEGVGERGGVNMDADDSGKVESKSIGESKNKSGREQAKANADAERQTMRGGVCGGTSSSNVMVRRDVESDGLAPQRPVLVEASRGKRRGRRKSATIGSASRECEERETQAAPNHLSKHTDIRSRRSLRPGGPVDPSHHHNPKTKTNNVASPRTSRRSTRNNHRHHENQSNETHHLLHPLLTLTSQPHALPFSHYSRTLGTHLRITKIAEASYAEVYRLTPLDEELASAISSQGGPVGRKASVLKVVALRPADYEAIWHRDGNSTADGNGSTSRNNKGGSKKTATPYTPAQLVHLPQMTSLSSLASELRLLRLMSPIPGFAVFRAAHLLRGPLPLEFVEAWRAYDGQIAGGSEFPDPGKKGRASAYLGEEQLWGVVEMVDAGGDLEALVERCTTTTTTTTPPPPGSGAGNVDDKEEEEEEMEKKAVIRKKKNGHGVRKKNKKEKEKGIQVWDIWDIFWSVAVALAKGEVGVGFEHRDLHLGNICIQYPSSHPYQHPHPPQHDYHHNHNHNQQQPRPRRRIDPTKRLGFTGLETTIIDYTLSRARLNASSHPHTYSHEEEQREQEEKDEEEEEEEEEEIAHLPLSHAEHAELFTADASDEYQYEVYRYMRNAVLTGEPFGSGGGVADEAEEEEDEKKKKKQAAKEGDPWRAHHPLTNLIWLHYILYKLLPLLSSPISGYPSDSSSSSSSFRPDTVSTSSKNTTKEEQEEEEQKGEEEEEPTNPTNLEQDLITRLRELSAELRLDNLGMRSRSWGASSDHDRGREEEEEEEVAKGRGQERTAGTGGAGGGGASALVEWAVMDKGWFEWDDVLEFGAGCDGGGDDGDEGESSLVEELGGMTLASASSSSS